MTSQMVLTIGRDALTLLLMISMPVLGVVMAVGLLVSIFQAVTQIHEATLAFVPKLIAAMVVFAIAGPWMLSTLVDFIRRTIESIPSMIGQHMPIWALGGLRTMLGCWSQRRALGAAVPWPSMHPGLAGGGGA